jgi:tripartite-type tricarboxylate transporter receptor subunit TctC
MVMRLIKALRALAPAVVMAAVAPAALAQDASNWPARQPVKIVVPFPPGGAADINARLLAAQLSKMNSANFYVENHAGANGIIGLDYVAKSAPDGYTLLSSNLSSHGTGPAVYKKLPYDPIKDFIPVVQVTTTPMLLVESPKLPYRSLQEVIQAAKANPGKITIASAGNGSSTHLAAEMLNEMAGIKLLHVPYKGDTPAMVDVASGVCDLLLVSTEASEPFLKSGKLRALAVGSPRRLPTLPDVPTISEAGVPGYVGSTWSGLLVPAGTPAAIVDKLNSQVNQIIQMPDFLQRVESAGSQLVGGPPATFATLIRSEIAKWTSVAHDNNIVLDH